MIKEEIIERIRLTAQVKDVVEDTGAKLKKHGADLTTCCPLHKEKTPSFHVNEGTNHWHCYGCGKSGDAIAFVREYKSLGYIDALKDLASKYNIEIEEARESAEEQRSRLERESMFLLNERVMRFYADLLQKSPKAKGYMDGRFGESFVKENFYGYAPGKNTLYHWAQEHGENIETLIDLSLLSINDENKQIYDFFNDRVLFPITDRSGHVIAFSGRTMHKEEEKGKKYINSRETKIYKKSKSIFGIHNAIPAARKKHFFYCVEGGPDAAKMQSAGIFNAIAALGGEWSTHQFETVKAIVPKIVFINDADPKESDNGWCTGIKILMKNAKLAIECGLEVGVRELLPYADGTKCDPGEFFNSEDDLRNYEQLHSEENFVSWYAHKLFESVKTSTEKADAIKEIAVLLANIKDITIRTIVMDEINTRHIKNKTLLSDRVNEAVIQKRIEKSKGTEIDISKYGFYISDSGYRSEGHTWSNFTMKPLFHIKDEDSPKRLFSIKNCHGQVERIAMTSEELSSVQKFRQRLLDMGDFMWEGDAAALIKLTRYLIGNTKSARMVHQMGYEPGAGYVFGNGIWTDEFIKADDDGIVDLGEKGCWYIPAASKSEADFEERYERERRFVYTDYVPVSLAKYLEDFCVVFGDNGKIGIAYWMMSLFHDIVVANTRKFPLLNLYGPKGTGKTEMGLALMAFFGAGNKAPNIRNSTFAALNNDISLYSNCLWHGDEFKNDLPPTMIEFLKGLYDGVGRTKLTGASYDERTMTRVKCGIILSGQEMPTVDIALFTRCIFLEFMNSKFTKEQSANFNRLFEVNRNGLTSLSVEVLKYRSFFDLNFSECYDEVMERIRAMPETEMIDTRIIECWTRLAATVKCLENKIRLPFSFESYMDLTVRGMVNQSKCCSQQDELARFWRTLEFLVDAGQLFELSDYRITTCNSIKTEEYSERIFDAPKRILLLNKTRIFQVYKKSATQIGEKPIAIDSLTSYLENCPQFLGHKNSVRYKWIVAGIVQQEVSDGKAEPIYKIRRSMVMNYDDLVKQYHLQLDGHATKEHTQEQSPQKKEGGAIPL